LGKVNLSPAYSNVGSDNGTVSEAAFWGTIGVGLTATAAFLLSRGKAIIKMSPPSLQETLDSRSTDRTYAKAAEKAFKDAREDLEHREADLAHLTGNGANPEG